MIKVKGVGVMKVEEVKLEEIEVSHTVSGPGGVSGSGKRHRSFSGKFFTTRDGVDRQTLQKLQNHTC